jgi:GxxExxY protein
MRYESNKGLKIKYDGKEVGIYKPDFIVEEKIVTEIKSVLFMPKVFELQLYYYLKGSKYRLGYIVNFGSDKIDIRRRIV